MNLSLRFENAPIALVEQLKHLTSGETPVEVQLGNISVKRLLIESVRVESAFGCGRVDISIDARQLPVEQPKKAPEPPPISKPEPPKAKIDPQQIKDLIETATPVVLDILSIVKALRRRR